MSGRSESSREEVEDDMVHHTSSGWEGVSGPARMAAATCVSTAAHRAPLQRREFARLVVRFGQPADAMSEYRTDPGHSFTAEMLSTLPRESPRQPRPVTSPGGRYGVWLQAGRRGGDRCRTPGGAARETRAGGPAVIRRGNRYAVWLRRKATARSH